ncbi:integrator complex subunit 1 isoform X2 [Sitophilus oryzae]|uniref:Integrator complex subunit 1 isoform X2 n=1 Tax=Sitophilus oryzae TaxID=7048 RepID=A0A6J2YFC5_SITOR|nr:integrator complex subunit 1 isoform X2 [Sitophilus oryzae]
MDRGKSLTGTRGPKSKISQQMPDSFIALGAKPGTSRDDSKRPIPLPKPSVTSLGSSNSADKLKREGSSSSLTVPPTKKLKVGLPGVSRPGVVSSSGSSLLTIDRMGGGTPGIEPWEVLGIDCEVGELFDKITPLLATENIDKLSGYILGLIKLLKASKSKPCKVVWSILCAIASLRSDVFTSEITVNAMVSVLRRDINAGLKNIHKSNSHVDQMFLNLIYFGFADKDNWPEIFVKLYVEDAIGDRVIIDSPFAKPFVDNVVTAFHTKLPPSSLLKSETWTSAARDTSSPLTINSVDEDDSVGEQKIIVESWFTKIVPRFTHSQEKVEQIVLEAIRELLARRQQPETISKNFVRFLSTACGLTEIRIIGVARIEAWLHNHKLMKPAQELLAYICYNCSANSQRDLEVIAQLSKLRLKNKPMVNYFNNCLREMVVAFPENLYPLLKYTIYNELSNARNPNNLIVVGALFQVKDEQAADALADICLELLLNKDDYLRSLRVLLKEINRVLRHDFNLLTVVHSLLRERPDLAPTIREHEFRERIFLSLVDLSAMCMLLCVSPQVRDAATQSKRDVTVLEAFKKQVANIQRECIIWLHEYALKIYRPNIADFHHALLKVLFLEQAEHYYKVDSWPGENERNLFLRLASEVPLLQTTLLRVLLIGINKEYPITPTEIVDIVDQLIKRAANLPNDLEPPLFVDKLEIVDLIFNLCSYNYPENITLPHGYVPPKLAISNLYWKAWLMLLILAAHNPLTIGNLAWNKYPTLKMFMEMCITNYFSYPPPTMISLEEDFQSKEQQVLVIEKQTILEFESHLAAASTKAEINEQTSLLLPQLMELNPQGDPRRPPPPILDILQTLNNSHRLGHLLCKSRHPDFLLDIMSRQGGTAHMPWLAELVHSSEGVLSHLPVQCLCEYLLSTAPAEKLTKHGQLLAHLRTVVNGPDPQTAGEVLEYLFRRLASDHGASRAQATKGLAMILAPSDVVTVEGSPETYINWLSQYITQFVHFGVIKNMLAQVLRQALQIETNPAIVSSYINFLATRDCYESFADLNELITDLSSVIIERHSVASYVLPGKNSTTLKNLLQIFCLYTLKAKAHAEESYAIHQGFNDYVIVSWGTGEQCAMQPLVIHAAIVLLTYGPLEHFEPFNILLNTWFPLNMDHPRAYSPDTSETTSYLPDWMKLRMIRSNVSTLVDAAIEKLEAPKLVLFIQSFGIPTSSISKLLNTLDKATILDQKLVMESVLDKTYMIQLVEVQNKRGAVGGDIFVKAIEMHIPPVPDVDIGVSVEVKKQLPVVNQKEKVYLNDKAIGESLNVLFNSLYSGDKNKIILSLVKSIKSKKYIRDLLFNYIKTVPISTILPNILQYNSFSTLFSLMFSRDSLNTEKQQFISKLLSGIPSNNCTARVLRYCLSECTKMEEDVKPQLNLEDIVKKEELITNVKSEEVLSRAESLGEKLGKILLEDQNEAEKTGLLVDWLSALELEIANSAKDKIQVDLLFSKNELHFRPLLMSLLLQRASWNSLQNLVLYLLSGDTNNSCPVAVLDFLTALIKSPKLWQGRDKAVPKHYHSEDVLQLNESQVKTVVAYILEESRIHQTNWKQKMEIRLQLLLKCIGNHATVIVRDLVKDLDTNIYSRELLIMIYMSLPYSGQNEIKFKPETALNISKMSCSSTIDKISHCLLSALAATPRSKDWPRKSQDLELFARKLTATHPLLVLRQLPMLAGSLKGRAQFDWSVLKSRWHFTLFGQVLGLMELLQPYIFQQNATLCELLDSYFLLLQCNSQRSELVVIVKRIVSFVQNWMVNDVKGASKFLQEHGSILNDIQFNQPGVRPLLSSVSLPTTDQEVPSELLVGAVNPPLPESYPQHWSQLKTSLQSSDSLGALQEIDHITNKRPQLLESVAQSLYGLMEAPNSSVRSLALLLINRWLKYNPKAASEALPAVLSCLDSQNGDAVASFLERLSDFVPVMQEYAKIILTKVFQLGMKSALSSSGSITKTIDLLCLQNGC